MRAEDWKPIDDFARSQEQVLIWEPGGGAYVARFDRTLSCHWRGTYGDGDAVFTPTHYQVIAGPEVEIPVQPIDDCPSRTALPPWVVVTGEA